MRPAKSTGAHVSHRLAELVCSNSLGSKLPDRATGILQNEVKMLGSLLIRCAEETAVPAGGALAVDRARFAERVTSCIHEHSNIDVLREEVRELPLDRPAIVATGPLTSPALAAEIARLTGVAISLLLRCDFAHCPRRQHRYEPGISGQSLWPRRRQRGRLHQLPAGERRVRPLCACAKRSRDN